MPVFCAAQKNGEKSQNCAKSLKKHMPGMCVHISLLGRGVIYILFTSFACDVRAAQFSAWNQFISTKQ